MFRTEQDINVYHKVKIILRYTVFPPDGFIRRMFKQNYV